MELPGLMEGSVYYIWFRWLEEERTPLRLRLWKELLLLPNGVGFKIYQIWEEKDHLQVPTEIQWIRGVYFIKALWYRKG